MLRVKIWDLVFGGIGFGGFGTLNHPETSTMEFSILKPYSPSVRALYSTRRSLVLRAPRLNLKGV